MGDLVSPIYMILVKTILRRAQTINDTKIKYISVADKIYEIIRISFYYMSVEAVKTDLTINNVMESEVWDISELKNYKMKLINNSGQAEIVDFDEWKDTRDAR